MTRRQWLLSVLIVWHVTAVLVQVVPDPNELPGFTKGEPAGGWRGVVTAGLDAAGLALINTSPKPYELRVSTIRGSHSACDRARDFESPLNRWFDRVGVVPWLRADAPQFDDVEVPMHRRT